MLYSRKHPAEQEIAFGCCYEHDAKQIEDWRVAATRLILAPQDGKNPGKIYKLCDDLERRINNRLAGTRLILADRQRMQTDGHHTFAILRKTKPPLIKKQGKWVEATMQQIARLEADGQRIVTNDCLGCRHSQWQHFKTPQGNCQVPGCSCQRYSGFSRRMQPKPLETPVQPAEPEHVEPSKKLTEITREQAAEARKQPGVMVRVVSGPTSEFDKFYLVEWE